MVSCLHVCVVLMLYAYFCGAVSVDSLYSVYLCFYSLVLCVFVFYFFFFKQKTAYEMLISDWSSDVCSSDLMAIASGMADGLGTGDNTRSAVITRGLAELTRLGCAMGGSQITFAGLAGMGDLIATCISPQSRNRYVGEQLGRGRKNDEIISEMNMVAEGVKTSAVVLELAEPDGGDLPNAPYVHQGVHWGRPGTPADRGLPRRPLHLPTDPQPVRRRAARRGPQDRRDHQRDEHGGRGREDLGRGARARRAVRRRHADRLVGALGGARGSPGHRGVPGAAEPGAALGDARHASRLIRWPPWPSSSDRCSRHGPPLGRRWRWGKDGCGRTGWSGQAAQPLPVRPTRTSADGP